VTSSSINGLALSNVSQGMAKPTILVTLKHNRPRSPSVCSNNPLANAAPTGVNQTNECQQDDRTQQGYEQRWHAEVVLVDCADPKEGGQEVARQECPDDANYDVENQTLPAIGSHDDAGNPTYERPSDKPNNEVHGRLLV
jgi:hypothetical protein